VRLNSRGDPIAIPTLPEWALPPGMTMAQSNGLAGDTRGPVDQRLTAEIECFRGTLGLPIYAEILRRTGHSHDARTIPNAERQKQTVEKMQAAARGFERLRHLAEMAGDAQFFAVTERFKIASVSAIICNEGLSQLFMLLLTCRLQMTFLAPRHKLFKRKRNPVSGVGICKLGNFLAL
jgi:hypothetical protein